MKLSIIGKGSVGGSLGGLLASQGHEVLYAGRGASMAKVGMMEDATILALPFTSVKDIAQDIKANLAGKIVIDATNPLRKDWSPLEVVDKAGSKSGAEAIQKLFPDSKVVKCFNTVFADNMKADIIAETNMTTFVAGDDKEARATVCQLAKSIGFDAVETGDLSTARYLESIAHLNIQLAVGMGKGTHKTGFLFLNKK